MEEIFVGRQEEIKILQKAIHSKEGELVAVVGRRRVGKTLLIRRTYEPWLKFEMAGIQNGRLAEQLQHFTDRLNYHIRPAVPFQTPANWLAAFNMLMKGFLIKKIETKKASKNL